MGKIGSAGTCFTSCPVAVLSLDFLRMASGKTCQVSKTLQVLHLLLVFLKIGYGAPRPWSRGLRPKGFNPCFDEDGFGVNKSESLNHAVSN